ncbi:hypothetical protein MU516_07670, partial [Paracoccus sp. YLB-12]
ADFPMRRCPTCQGIDYGKGCPKCAKQPQEEEEPLQRTFGEDVQYHPRADIHPGRKPSSGQRLDDGTSPYEMDPSPTSHSAFIRANYKTSYALQAGSESARKYLKLEKKLLHGRRDQASTRINLKFNKDYVWACLLMTEHWQKWVNIPHIGELPEVIGEGFSQGCMTMMHVTQKSHLLVYIRDPPFFDHFRDFTIEEVSESETTLKMTRFITESSFKAIAFRLMSNKHWGWSDTEREKVESALTASARKFDDLLIQLNKKYT